MEISSLPQELRELALQRQGECKAPWTSRRTDKIEDAFDWTKTLEGYHFWDDVYNGTIKTTPEKYKIESNKFTIDFVDWLMNNCELAEDKSLWMYQSEDYSNEGLLLIYMKQISK